MDDLYGRIPYRYLQLVRINRTAPLYSGCDHQGDPMANWAMDSLIETVQKYYHKMNFHTGKSNGWFKHSAHVMLMSKASRIVVEEYSKVNGTEDRDSKFVDHQDQNLNTTKAIKNTKNSSIPRRERESSAVAEYLFLSKMTKEINGRLYNDEEMWKVINECTVDLIVETERERER